uniref:Uncharacterized protein n=1 Tax=Romanomermis culicivorax TaxID=13658 RepID=A0A915KT31_ROMCU
KVLGPEPYYCCGIWRSGWALVIPKQAPCRPPSLMATKKRMINVSIWSPSVSYQQHRFQSLITRYLVLFAHDDNDISWTSLVKHLNKIAFLIIRHNSKNWV